MIKHIVLWKLDDSYSNLEKEEIIQEFRQKLFGLKDQIQVLLNLEVYLNSDKPSGTNYDIMLDTVFNSIDELTTYQLHPEHVKVVEYIKSIKLQRAVIDFQF